MLTIKRIAPLTKITLYYYRRRSSSFTKRFIIIDTTALKALTLASNTQKRRIDYNSLHNFGF